MQLEIFRGHDVLVRLGPQFDELVLAASAPVTARRPWLQAWLQTYSSYEPVILVVVGPCGRLEAAAPLAVRQRSRNCLITALGHGPSDAALLPARSATAADLLAAGIKEWLESETRNWSLALRHLTAGDLVGKRLPAHIRRTRYEPGAVSPQLHVDANEAPSLSDYVSSRHTQEVRRRWRRMMKDGMGPAVEQVTRRDEIKKIMPQVEEVFRARDAALHRRCALDDKFQGPFFRTVVETHAMRQEVCLTTLFLNGQLAAYVLCFIDGDTYRMWNCRFDPRFARYSPGMVAMDSSVAHALMAGCRTYDFMRGEEPYKASYANHLERAKDVRAWSGPLLQAKYESFRAVKNRAEKIEGRGGRRAEFVATARSVAERVQSR